MIAYKLTTQDHKTRPGYSNECLWGENVTHEAPGIGNLCTDGWIHAYEDPLTAVFMNPMHCAYEPAVLWECQCTGNSKDDNSLKMGVQKCTTLRIIEQPVITPEQRIRTIIKCISLVYRKPKWLDWATEYLKNPNIPRYQSDEDGQPCFMFTLCDLLGKHYPEKTFNELTAGIPINLTKIDEYSQATIITHNILQLSNSFSLHRQIQWALGTNTEL